MLEILAVIKDIGEIKDDRSQTIKLSDVAYISGEYCQGRTMKVIFMSNEEWKEYREFKIAKDNKEIHPIASQG